MERNDGFPIFQYLIKQSGFFFCWLAPQNCVVFSPTLSCVLLFVVTIKQHRLNSLPCFISPCHVVIFYCLYISDKSFSFSVCLFSPKIKIQSKSEYSGRGSGPDVVFFCRSYQLDQHFLGKKRINLIKTSWSFEYRVRRNRFRTTSMWIIITSKLICSTNNEYV